VQDDEDVRRKRNVMGCGEGSPATDRQMTGQNPKKRVRAEARRRAKDERREMAGKRKQRNIAVKENAQGKWHKNKQ